MVPCTVQNELKAKELFLFNDCYDLMNVIAITQGVRNDGQRCKARLWDLKKLRTEEWKVLHLKNLCLMTEWCSKVLKNWLQRRFLTYIYTYSFILKLTSDLKYIFIFVYQKSFNELLQTVFEYKITF